MNASIVTLRGKYFLIKSPDKHKIIDGIYII